MTLRNLCSITAGTVCLCILRFSCYWSGGWSSSGFFFPLSGRPIMPNFSIANSHWWVFDHMSTLLSLSIMAWLCVLVSRFLLRVAAECQYKCYCIFSILPCRRWLIRSVLVNWKAMPERGILSRPLDSVLGSDVCPSKLMVVFCLLLFNVSSQCIVSGFLVFSCHGSVVSVLLGKHPLCLRNRVAYDLSFSPCVFCVFCDVK